MMSFALFRVFSFFRGSGDLRGFLVCVCICVRARVCRSEVNLKRLDTFFEMGSPLTLEFGIHTPQG